jgi:hypothetical protein
MMYIMRMSLAPATLNLMSKDITVDQDKFDAVLRRLLNSKPTSKAEISAKIKAEKEAKRVQKNGQG